MLNTFAFSSSHHVHAMYAVHFYSVNHLSKFSRPTLLQPRLRQTGGVRVGDLKERTATGAGKGQLFAEDKKRESAAAKVIS